MSDLYNRDHAMTSNGKDDNDGWGESGWGDDGWGESPEAGAPGTGDAEEDDLGLAQTQALTPVRGPESEDWGASAQPASPGAAPVFPGEVADPQRFDVGKAAAPGAPESHLPPRKSERASAPVSAQPEEHVAPDAPLDMESALAERPPGEVVAEGFSAVEIEEGKTMAILVHAANVFGIPLWILPLFLQKDNGFAMFHAKQAAAGTAIILVGWVVVSVIGTLTCGVGLILGLALPIVGIWPAIWAMNGQAKKLPLVGDTVADIFKGQVPDKKS